MNHLMTWILLSKMILKMREAEATEEEEEVVEAVKEVQEEERDKEFDTFNL